MTNIWDYILPEPAVKFLNPIAEAVGTTVSTVWKGVFMPVDAWYGKKGNRP